MANNIQVPAYLQGAVGRILEGVDSARGAETTPVTMSQNEKDIEENPDSTKTVAIEPSPLSNLDSTTIAFGFAFFSHVYLVSTPMLLAVPATDFTAASRL